MNKFSLYFLSGIVSVWSSFVLAGGFVGTGAGIVEANFNYAYSALPRFIRTCQNFPDPDNLILPLCSRSGLDSDLLSRISSLAVRNRSKVDRLIFASEREEPNLFKTGIAEPHRIAVTDYSPDAPIYINVDQLYHEEDGAPAIGLAEIVGILVHELGHQVGEVNHDRLNIIAAQVRSYVELNTKVYEYETGTMGPQTIFVRQAKPNRSLMIFNWPGILTLDLTHRVASVLKCKQSTSTMTGIVLSNGQFEMSSKIEEVIRFNFWADFNCRSEKSGTFDKERLRLRFIIRDQKNIEIKLLK